MRCRSTGPRRMRRSALGLVLLCLLAPSAWGYRPFVSTDAAVVDSKEVEIELGYFTLERTQGENTFTIPSLVLNYGLLTNVELVGEYRPHPFGFGGFVKGLRPADYAKE